MKLINEASGVSLAIVVVVVTAAIYIGTYLGSISAQGAAISDIQKRLDQKDRDAKEFRQMYAEDMGNLRVDVATIRAILQSEFGTKK